MRKIIATLALLSFLFLIPSVQAGISFQPPEFKFENTMKGITKYLDMKYYEISETRWLFEIYAKDVKAMLKEYSISDLQNLKEKIKALNKTIVFDIGTENEMSVTEENIKISNIKVDLANRKIYFYVDFIRSFTPDEKIQIGEDSITLNSGGNLITIDGISSYPKDLYIADKNSTYELLANQTGTSDMLLTNQIRPADNVTIPISLNITGLDSAGTCNITGSIYNSSSIIENITISADGIYNTSWYWSNISAVDCSETFDIQIFQKQWGVVWEQTPSMPYVNITYGKQYVIGARVNITEDAEFLCNYTQIAIPDGMSGITWNSPIFDVYGNLTFGKYNKTHNMTSEGCHLLSTEVYYFTYMIRQEAGGIISIYDSSITSVSTQRHMVGIGNNSKVIDTTFSRTQLLYDAPSEPEIRRLNLHSSIYGVTSPQGSIDDVYIFDSGYAIKHQIGQPSTTVYNVKIRNSDTVYQTGAVNNDQYFVNPDIDSWSFYFSSASTGFYYENYEFDLKVIDSVGSPIANAKVNATYTQGYNYDYLYVDGFGNDVNGWNTVGAEPWLDADDYAVNYIWDSILNREIGDFSFADLTADNSGIVSVTFGLRGLKSGIGTAPVVTVYIYDGSTWTNVGTATYTSFVPLWSEIDVSAILDTEEKINNAELLLNKTGGSAQARIDASKLIVKYKTSYMSAMSAVTNADGSIPTQELESNFYEVNTGNVANPRNPIIFTIEKSGYETLNFTTDITEKTDWALYLKSVSGSLNLPISTQAFVRVFGSIYAENNNATTYATVYDSSSNTVDTATCSVSYYSLKSKIIEPQTMTFGFGGTYYYNYEIPSNFTSTMFAFVNCTNPHVNGTQEIQIPEWITSLNKSVEYWQYLNNTFFWWNNTLFANWNGTIYDISNNQTFWFPLLNETQILNFSELWDNFDCSNQTTNEMCRRLAGWIAEAREIKEEEEETQELLGAFTTSLAGLIENRFLVLGIILALLLCLLIILELHNYRKNRIEFMYGKLPKK